MGKISVYVPCYNGAGFVTGCIESLQAQSLPPDEIIFVDDGSRDESATLAESLGVTVVRHGENRGLSAARNTAFEVSRNELVASLDVDCVAEPTWLTELHGALNSDELAGVGGCLNETFCEERADAWRTHHMPQHWGKEEVIGPPFLFGNNNLYRKSAIFEAGGFDERFRTNFEDVDMGRKLCRNGYLLLYNPRARVNHLRRDSFRSVLLAYWRWTLLDFCEPTSFREAMRKHYYNFWKSYVFITQDVIKNRLSLIPLDAALAPYHSFLDFRYALAATFRK